MKRQSFAVALGLVALALACEYERVEESTTERRRFDTGERTAVRVRVDDGRIEVIAGTPGTVEVSFRHRARASDRAGARSLLESIRTEAVQQGDLIRVSARAHGSGAVTIGGSVWTEVTVRVPPESLELDLHIDDGRIEIEGVSGRLSAESGDGRIRIANVDGTITLRTLDGSITGNGVTGNVDVLTDDGRIRLDGAFSRLKAVTADGSVRVTARDPSAIADDWSLRSSDGAIELTLPESIEAEIDAAAADGRIINELSRFDGIQYRNRVRGALGAGGPRILVATMDGTITLKH